jgi:hypothetical protein
VEVSSQAVGGAEGRNSLGFLPRSAQSNSLLWSEPFFDGLIFFGRKDHFPAPDQPNRTRPKSFPPGDSVLA